MTREELLDKARDAMSEAAAASTVDWTRVKIELADGWMRLAMHLEASSAGSHDE